MKPKVYIHRIGPSYRDYMTDDNEEMLGSFATVINDGPVTEKIDRAELVRKLGESNCLLSLNGNGATDITEDILLEAGTVEVAVISHYYHVLHDKAIRAWKSAGVEVIDASDGNNRAVAEWTLGAAITGMYRFLEYDRAMKSGVFWPDSSGADQLEGKTVGIVGLGRVGRIVASYLGIFDLELIGYDAYLSEQEIRDMGVEPVELMDLMRRSDIITFHLPVTEETRGLIDAKHLEAVKDGALIINSARAAIFDGRAFRAELARDRFRAVMDVYEPEPPPLDDPLRGLENVVMTPHIAGNTRQMRHDCGKIAIGAIREYFQAR